MRPDSYEQRKQHELDVALGTSLTFDKFFMKNPLPMWIFDSETLRFLEVNDATVSKYGYTREEFMQMSVLDIRPEREAERFLKYSNRFIRDFSFDGVWKHRLRDGSETEVEVFANVMTYLGRPAVAVTVHDITGLTRQSEIIRLQSIALEAATNGILIMDAETTVIWANRSFSKITGYEADKITGLKAFDLTIPEDSREAILQEMLSTVKKGEQWSHQLVARRQDESSFYADVAVSPMSFDGGNVTHLVQAVTDVTQKKLIDEELRQAQKLESLGQLTAGIAHDFNNIIGGIIGFSQLALRRKSGDEQIRTYLGRIISLASKAAEVTKQLLAFSRKQVIQARDIDVNELIKGLLRLLPQVIRGKVHVMFKPASEGAIVHADAAQLQQVFLNLIVNANDAMPDGGDLTIKVENVCVDQANRMIISQVSKGGYVLVSIADTGVGIGKEILDRIYEPFFTTKEFGRGTGLGLSVVHGIVKQHGGLIDVESTPGRGTIFGVYLPSANSSRATGDPNC